MKKILFIAILVISSLRADMLDDWRSFAYFGYGLYASSGKISLTDYSEKFESKNNNLELFFGLEYNDGDFNGVNLVLSSSVALADEKDDTIFSEIAFMLGVNYVFEPQEWTPNFALITGFDIGTRSLS